MRIDGSDLHLALEYAYLCYEARENAPARKREARRIFAHVRDLAQGELRAQAAAAYENVDEPLRTGIARWQRALASAPATFSAHYELAQLAEARNELDLAAQNYRAAFSLQPDRKSVLLELARVEEARGNSEGRMAALLAASRGGEPRASEAAREQLPDRYPWVYEFRKALELDPGNNTLHRELAFLLLRMSEQGQASREEAEEEFRKIVALAPDDYLAAAQLGLLYLADHQPARAMPLLDFVLEKGDAATANRVRMARNLPLVLEERQAPERAIDPRILAERSYAAGFLKDARKYFLQAIEQNPIDSSVALKLGWTNNMLRDDHAALHWFRIARKSADPAVAAEAARAYSNLSPGLERFRTTLWIYPLLSSRWGDLFGYGQIKTELRLSKLRVHPYISLRFVGDARRSTGGVSAQSLSENAFIAGAGVATNSWRGAMAWFEGGSLLGYLNPTRKQDYRGGINFSRTWGRSIAASHGGWFFRTIEDSLYISEFANDFITYSQNEAGRTTVLAGAKIQTFWNANLTFDAKRQYWANFGEMGPGFRLHLSVMPPPMTITVGAVRGFYLCNDGNPRRPNYNDVRAGIWYAFTR